jgi:hypothetical protein
MNTTYPKPIWIDRFTMQLGQLRPDLAPILVTAVALAEFREAGFLEPEKAASNYADHTPAAAD